jgi:hypothetical protein
MLCESLQRDVRLRKNARRVLKPMLGREFRILGARKIRGQWVVLIVRGSGREGLARFARGQFREYRDITAA